MLKGAGVAFAAAPSQLQAPVQQPCRCGKRLIMPTQKCHIASQEAPLPRTSTCLPAAMQTAAERCSARTPCLWAGGWRSAAAPPDSRAATCADAAEQQGLLTGCRARVGMRAAASTSCAALITVRSGWRGGAARSQLYVGWMLRWTPAVHADQPRWRSSRKLMLPAWGNPHSPMRPQQKFQPRALLTRASKAASARLNTLCSCVLSPGVSSGQQPCARSLRCLLDVRQSHHLGFGDLKQEAAGAGGWQVGGCTGGTTAGCAVPLKLGISNALAAALAAAEQAAHCLLPAF